MDRPGRLPRGAGGDTAASSEVRQPPQLRPSEGVEAGAVEGAGGAQSVAGLAVLS